MISFLFYDSHTNMQIYKTCDAENIKFILFYDLKDSIKET